jgi:hypothetical protein
LIYDFNHSGSILKAKIEELEEHKIDTWREVLKEYRRPFLFLKPDDR